MKDIAPELCDFNSFPILKLEAFQSFLRDFFGVSFIIVVNKSCWFDYLLKTQRVLIVRGAFFVSLVMVIMISCNEGTC